MQIEKGFSLIECIIYCFILMLIISISSSFVSKSLMQLKESRVLMQSMISLYACADVITHDIYQLDQSLPYCIIKDSELVFSGKDYHIGWHFYNKKIYRTIGQFDFNKKSWHEKSIALVAAQIEKCIFIFDKNHNQLQSITVELKGHTTLITKKISLINRIIL